MYFSKLWLVIITNKNKSKNTCNLYTLKEYKCINLENKTNIYSIKLTG